MDGKSYDSIRSRCSWRPAGPWALAWLCLLGSALPATAQDPAAFAARVEAMLAREQLSRDKVALLIRSVPDDAVLYALRPDAPMIPASNVKLITSYAALRQLTPNYRWKTRLYLVEEDEGSALPPRQGLLIESGADPTLQRGDLEAIARTLRALGVTALDGHLWYDGGILAGPAFPMAWGDVDLDMPWYAQITPFILNLNQAVFTVRVTPGAPAQPGAAGATADPALAEVFPHQPLPGMQVRAQFNWIPEGREVVRVRQVPAAPEPTFSVSGDLLPTEHNFIVATAINDPHEQFFQQLRLALQEAGIVGTMAPAPVEMANFASVRAVYTRESEPLAAFLPLVNKDSSNLGAEILLRTLAFGGKRRGITPEDGLAVARAVLQEDFLELSQPVVLADGSGLSRENRVTAAFMVALLERVLQRFEFRSEFVSSLSISGRDGTLLDHSLPRRYSGQIRAKTGTLKGVQNVSGYFNFGNRLLAFAFLVRDESKDATALQRAQDRALAGILDAYLEWILPPRAVKRGRPKPPLPPLAPAKESVTAGAPKQVTGAGR